METLDSKNSNPFYEKPVFIIISALIILSALGFFIFKYNNSKVAFQIPKEYVLDYPAKRVSSADRSVTTIQFSTKRTLSELKQIYTTKLTSDGWTILKSNAQRANQTDIIATKIIGDKSYVLHIAIISSSKNDGSFVVGLILQHTP